MFFFDRQGPWYGNKLIDSNVKLCSYKFPLPKGVVIDWFKGRGNIGSTI